jgi:hypothetical protein
MCYNMAFWYGITAMSAAYRGVIARNIRVVNIRMDLMLVFKKRK